MSVRPRVRRHFRPLLRGPGEVQFGMSSTTGAVVVRGLTPAEIGMLARLDGAHSHQHLAAEAAATGIEPDRWRALLDTLAAHRVLAPDDLDRTDLAPMHPVARLTAERDAEVVSLAGGRGVTAAARHVVVGGEGDLATDIAHVLRQGGVGRVQLGWWALDECDARLRDADLVGRPDLVVLVAGDSLDAALGEPWLRRAVPHLPVVVDGPRVVVGPLAGHNPDAPCLRCLELHRTDRDPAQPLLGAQLGDVLGPAPPAASETALSCAAAGVVAMVVHAALRGQPPPPGIACELSLPWPRVDHRRWTRHPNCAVHPDRARVSPDVIASDSPPGVTMAG